MSHDRLAGLLPAGNPLAPFDAAALLDAPDEAMPELDTIPEVELDLGSGAVLKRGAAETSAAERREPNEEQELLPDDDEELVPELEIAQDAPVAPIPAITSIPEFASPRTGSGRVSARNAPAIAGRRRRSRNAPLLIGMGLVVCVGIGVCVYLLASGLGISQHGELVAVQPEANEQPADPGPANPEPANPAPQAPVRASMPQSAPAAATPAAATPAAPAASSEAPVPDAPAPQASAPEAVTPEVAMADPAPPEVAMPEAGGASPLEPAMEAIRGGQYDAMLAAAEQAQQAAMTPEERELAAGMHLLAELADYYVEGIRRGADGLGAAETFEIVPDLTAIVVESSRDSLVLKINGRVKSYSFEAMPLVLAHRLTAFSLPAEDPVAKAAAGAYQAVWPQATHAHRRQAFEWWRKLDGEAAGADFTQLEPTVRKIFEMPES